MKKQKVAIVTLYGEDNHGNRLQNYAVHKVLKSMNFMPVTIANSKYASNPQGIKGKMLWAFMRFFPDFLAKRTPQFVRFRKFKIFTQRHIPTRYVALENDVFPSWLQDEMDYFVVGSDQVWNPTFGDYRTAYDNMFLRFVPKEKRVCFSPSIGLSEIPKEWEEPFAEGWQGFYNLSVREEAGAELIKKLTGREAQVLIDPTLMLTKEDWLKIAKKNHGIKKPYVLEYFLGNRDDKKLDKIANERGLERITLLDKNNDFYCKNPAEFIDLIANADLICTDSFHACVFSIIFEKPFIICKRKENIADMYSRIDTLLTMFGVHPDSEIIKIDQETRDKVLSKERKKVLDFLSKSFTQPR